MSKRARGGRGIKGPADPGPTRRIVAPGHADGAQSAEGKLRRTLVDTPSEHLLEGIEGIHSGVGLPEPTPEDVPEEKTTTVTAISKISEQALVLEGCLVVIYGEDLGKRWNLGVGTVTIGRAPSNTISLDQESVSRAHAKIIEEIGRLVLKDLDSTNGTYVNDDRISEHVLRDGDLIKIGRTIFKYLSGGNVETSYHEEIYRLTTIDGLTQVFNKRFFLEALGKELSRARRYSRILSLAMFDIDNFKQINDRLGHLAGDQILKMVAQAIKPKIRREDTFARYGGEEFAVILPEIELEQARVFGDKIRKIIAEHEFKLAERVTVTISVGVAELDPSMTEPEMLIQRADEKLYRAKQEGRNRVCS